MQETPQDPPKDPPKKKSKAAKAAKEQKAPEASKTDSTPEDAEKSAMLQLLQPLIDFHQEAESAREDDVHIFWDVRILKGRNREVIDHITGNSAMPGLLSVGIRGQASSSVEREFQEKIVRPANNSIQLHVASNNGPKLESIRENLQSAADKDRKFLPSGSGDGDEELFGRIAFTASLCKAVWPLGRWRLTSISIQ